MTPTLPLRPTDPADSHLYALARSAMATSVPGQPWDWPTLDFEDPAQCRFGDYELRGEIGRGGMGVVYRAWQLSLQREVALKFIAAGMADALQVARFLDEARAAARLTHPNIVPVHEVGSVGAIHYFSMALVAGESLEARLQSAPLAPDALLSLLLPVCEAIDYAHRLKLLHLDLKPANILIDARGEPLVADFGLARHVDDSGSVAAQEVSGTPAFMAPEQILIQQYRLTAATDVYALGALLYRSLAGVSPHGEGGAEDLFRRALAGRIKPLRERLPKVSADLSAVVGKCLELEPRDRYASVRALIADLRCLLAGLPVSVRRPGRMERLRRWLGREPRLATAASVAFAAVLAGSIATAWLWRASESARMAAEQAREAAERAREAEAAQREQAQWSAALGAHLYASGTRIKHSGDAERAVIDWLQQHLPERADAQARVLGDFGKALAAEDSRTAVQGLLVRVQEALGRDYRRQLVDVMATRNDAGTLVYAAMLAWAEDQAAPDLGRTRTLLQRAVALDPAHEFAWYAGAMYCVEDAVERCALPDAAERLLRLRPDNAWAWVTLAVHQRGAAAYATLAEAARRPALDDYLGAQYADQARAIAASGVPMPPLFAALARVLSPDAPDATVSMIEASSMPQRPLRRLLDLCRPGGGLPAGNAAARASCLALGVKMARHPGSLLVRMLGVTLVRRLAPGTALDREMLQLRARYWYLIEQDDALTPAQEASYSDRRMLDDARAAGELEAYVRKLEFFGLPTEPPAGWQPKAGPEVLLLPEERNPKPID